MKSARNGAALRAARRIVMASVVAILILAIPQAGCRSEAPSLKEKDMITIYQSSVDPGDPHICSDSANRLSLLFSVYEALVAMDDSGGYRPSLAESWSVAEDGRSWTFRLRAGVRLHNGEILCAEDVVATLGRVLDPAIGGAFGTQGVYLSYLGDAEISQVDDLTVRIVTGEPMADLLDLLAAMPISPASALGRLPREYVGSGPYRVRGRTDGEVLLEAFPDYWGEAPRYERVRWVGEPDAAKRVDALLAGRADIVAGIEDEGRRRISAATGVSLHEWKSGLCVIFMLNAFEGPCRDARVRQALNYALDVDAIIAEVMGGAATRLNGYLTPHHFGYDPETPVYPHDPAKARALLAEAGHADGLKLSFDIPASMPDEAPRLAEVMARQFAEVGVSVEIIAHEDRAAYSEMVREKRIHDACCFDSSPRSTFRVLREKLQSTLRGPWWEGYENEEVDVLITQAQATFDDAQRQAVYRRIYRIIRDDAPWIFLYRPTNYWGVSEQLKGWQPQAGLILPGLLQGTDNNSNSDK